MSKNRVIDYESRIQKALREVVRDILIDVANNGLQEPHHFYITFDTNHPWVKIPDYLKEEYPSEMVIVLQYDFSDLTVSDDVFSILLEFDDVDENITIPFMSLINFVDPSVKFGLQFAPDYDIHERKKDNSGETKKKSIEKG
ncbi:MAG: ClpXP protease specificity-enhancing factor SspB, partial [Holosporaceae bacterium]|nr:ClpXP protease specificity-enhancing factor SspB [Holosporaceae bacterium]